MKALFPEALALRLLRKAAITLSFESLGEAI